MITIINPISILKILFYRQKNIFNITRKPPQQRGREEVRVQSTNSGTDWILDDNCNCIIVKQYNACITMLRFYKLRWIIWKSDRWLSLVTVSCTNWWSANVWMVFVVWTETDCDGRWTLKHNKEINQRVTQWLCWWRWWRCWWLWGSGAVTRHTGGSWPGSRAELQLNLAAAAPSTTSRDIINNQYSKHFNIRKASFLTDC